MEIKTGNFNLLHCNFGEIKFTYIYPAPLQLQGDKDGVFDLLHCNFRKTRFTIFSLLHCKLKKARLVTLICFTATSERQDLLSLVCSTANLGRQDWEARLVSSICFTATSRRQDPLSSTALLQTQGGKVGVFDLFHYNFRKTRFAIFSLFCCKLREARLVSSIYFVVNSGRQDLLSSAASLQTQGGKAGVFDLLHYNFRKIRSAIFSLLCCKLREARLVSLICSTVNSRRQDLLSSAAPLQTQGGKASAFDLLHCNFRKTRSTIFSLLRCKLREARLVSLICLPTTSGRQDL
ncbi:hypothetical protein J1N35_015329 [Gossypium stocksii]|uniref:Uncharacterized protein n=1 Tax=Gossypium stocksii TaxID=47602 RepID=A0A9D3VWI4_9ROSI|nr:hypothetical protein J1N35_015329 [Gossypium stocksii]